MAPDCKELVEGVELSHVLVELGRGHCGRLVASGTYCCASVTMFVGDPISNQMVHHNYQRYNISWALIGHRMYAAKTLKQRAVKTMACWRYSS